MVKLPENVSFYRRTALFGPNNIPSAFTREHKIAEGKWGVLHLSEGELLFCDDQSLEKTKLRAGDQVVIAPGVAHHLELDLPQNNMVEFYIDFYK